jgi:hypothetical protein
VACEKLANRIPRCIGDGLCGTRPLWRVVVVVVGVVVLMGGGLGLPPRLLPPLQYCGHPSYRLECVMRLTNPPPAILHHCIINHRLP